MKAHLFWVIYVITLTVMGGWYIKEQKAIIAEQKFAIQELTVSQHPPVEPEKRKIKIIEQEIDKKEVCKDIIAEFNTLRDKTLQCAYNLKFCQESSEIYGKMKPQGEVKDGTTK